MSLRRVGWTAAVALGAFLGISCGDIFRPVVIPVNTTPPTPQNFHEVFGVGVNAPYNPGTSFQIDVSGDSDIGAANVGVNPTHAAILPNNSQVFVAAAGSIFTGLADLVTSYTPATDSSSATGVGFPTSFSFPNIGAGSSSLISSITETGNVVTMTTVTPLYNAVVGAVVSVSSVSVTGYDGTFAIASVSQNVVNGTPVQTITYVDSTTGLTPGSGGTASVPVICSYLPDFVATGQSNAVYVSSYGVENAINCNLSSTDSVALLNPAQTTITNIAYLGAGTHPVGMVETTDGINLYILQSNNIVTDLSPADLTPMPISTIPVGQSPTWAVARPDNLRLYVVTQGDGQLYTIRTDTNQIVSTQAVGGPGANYVYYDLTRNRLFVTNPTAGAVYVFAATTDPPTPVATLKIAAPTVSVSGSNCAAYTCTYTSVAPTSVAALQDGSRFYVASYVTGTATAAGKPTTCPDKNVSAAGCIIPQVSVYDAATFTLKSTIFPLIPNITSSTSKIPFAVPPVAYCAPVEPYVPTAARFRMSVATSIQSQRAYAAVCDAGWVAVIAAYPSPVAVGSNNTGDTLVTDLDTPFGAGAQRANGQAPLQYPVFLLTGQ
jgi:hypothetical protein